MTRPLRPFVSSLMAIVAVWALIGCAAQRPAADLDPGAEAAARAFLAVVATGRAADLRSHLDAQESGIGGTALTDEARRLVFDGAWLRDFVPGGRSITELASMGDPALLGATQPDGSVIVSFVPPQYAAEATEMAFFTEQWMRRYFACRFAPAGDRWVLAENLCFAESDGPYPVPAG